MAMTTRAESHLGESTGGVVDGVGGVAVIALAIIGLAHTVPEMMVSVATIVFGAALTVQGGALFAEFAGIVFPSETATTDMQIGGGGSLAAVFVAGVAGIVLGILGVLGIAQTILTSAAIIAFGAALVLSSGAVWQLQRMKRAVSTSQTGSRVGDILAGEMAFSTMSVQAVAGIAAAVLGIIALAGGNAMILDLVALLVLGAAIILTSTTLSATVVSFLRTTTNGRRSSLA